MAAHNEAFWKEQGRQWKELARELPGRTGKDYHKLMGSGEMLEWRKAKGRADIAAEKQAWERDHPGKEYPEHECGLSDHEYTDRARWRRQRERRLRGPQHKALPRKRLPDDRPGAAVNKEIRRLLDFTFPFIGRLTIVIFAASSRGRIAKQLSTRCGSPWMSWGISHNA